MEGDCLRDTYLLGYSFESCIHIGMGRKVENLVILLGWHPCFCG